MYNHIPKGLRIMSEKKKKFKLWKIPVWIIVIALLVAAGYVAFVFLTYSRIEDMMPLETDGNGDLL